LEDLFVYLLMIYLLNMCFMLQFAKLQQPEAIPCHRQSLVNFIGSLPDSCRSNRSRFCQASGLQSHAG
jgi:hypothetical protein